METTQEKRAWYARPTAGHETHGQSVVYDERGRSVAIVYDGAADANLIAAAPELLNALQLAAATIERLNRHDSANGTLDVVRSAIAAATA